MPKSNSSTTKHQRNRVLQSLFSPAPKPPFPQQLPPPSNESETTAALIYYLLQRGATLGRIQGAFPDITFAYRGHTFSVEVEYHAGTYSRTHPAEGCDAVFACRGNASSWPDDLPPLYLLSAAFSILPVRELTTLMDRLGSRAGLARITGCSPTMVSQCATRGTAPAAFIHQLEAIAKKRRIPYSAEQLHRCVIDPFVHPTRARYGNRHVSGFIERLGGAHAVAHQMHASLSTVQKWTITGRISERYRNQLTRLAKKKGFKVAVKDFGSDCPPRRPWSKFGTPTALFFMALGTQEWLCQHLGISQPRVSTMEKTNSVPGGYHDALIGLAHARKVPLPSFIRQPSSLRGLFLLLGGPKNIARLLKVHPCTVSKWIKAARLPSERFRVQLRKLAKLAKIRLDEEIFGPVRKHLGPVPVVNSVAARLVTLVRPAKKLTAALHVSSPALYRWRKNQVIPQRHRPAFRRLLKLHHIKWEPVFDQAFGGKRASHRRH